MLGDYQSHSITSFHSNHPFWNDFEMPKNPWLVWVNLFLILPETWGVGPMTPPPLVRQP